MKTFFQITIVLFASALMLVLVVNSYPDYAHKLKHGNEQHEYGSRFAKAIETDHKR